MQHAHQKGIIDRDLRPSKILVTVIDGAAVPEIIDFGVSKATGGSLTERTLYTAFHQFVGTPLYVSPEQVELAGVDVDTRSDIYSLGVRLYAAERNFQTARLASLEPDHTEKHAEAEPLAREAAASFGELYSDDERHFYWMSVRGAALCGLGRFAWAEPHLLRGHEGVKSREAIMPATERRRLTETRERVVLF